MEGNCSKGRICNTNELISHKITNTRFTDGEDMNELLYIHHTRFNLRELYRAEKLPGVQLRKGIFVGQRLAPFFGEV